MKLRVYCFGYLLLAYERYENLLIIFQKRVKLFFHNHDENLIRIEAAFIRFFIRLANFINLLEVRFF
jgi:hypothetical protein